MASFTALTVLSLLALVASPSLSLSEASAAMSPQRPRGPAVAAQFLSAINDARAKIGVPPLSWDATVAQNAKAHANWLRTFGGCELAQIDRSPVPLVGGLTTYRSPDRRTPADAVWTWLDESRWYDHDANACGAGKQCGDYKLVVTRAWQQLGCAVVACASGGGLMVCEYAPGTNRMPDPKEPPY